LDNSQQSLNTYKCSWMFNDFKIVDSKGSKIKSSPKGIGNSVSADMVNHPLPVPDLLALERLGISTVKI